MKQEFFPFERSSDVIHQLRRDHFPSGVPWTGSNVQQNVMGVLAILKSCFIAFPK